jgi:hypothetical protein
MLDIRELMNLKEAYAEVYTPQELTEEQVWEEVEIWVNSLIEEGYDLSDYSWEEMYESYIEEQGQSGSSPRASAGVSQDSFSRAIRGDGQARNQPKPGSNIRGGGQFRPKMGSLPPSARQVTQYPQGVSTGVGGGNSGASRSATPAKPATTPARPSAGAPAASRPSAGAPATSARPSAGASAAPRPAATTSAAPRPAATTPAAKPAPAATAPAAKPSAMDQFAKANPKLAAASAERARTRGTSATTNPLMKDMKSRLPAPKTPSPTTAKTGFDLAKKGVNLAASFDMFDVVKGYLIGEGYADTEEAALAIMINMSEEWREDILAEAITSEKGKAKAAEMIAARSTPSGRAKSGKGANVAQIKHISRANVENLSGTPPTPTIAKNPVKSRSYGGTGNKAARRAGTYKESFNIFVNSMIAEGVSMERYTWEEIQNVFDDLFEAQVANRNPDEYERKAKQGQSREQQLKGRVMGRMNQMDPDKKEAMLKQMRAVGLDV